MSEKEKNGKGKKLEYAFAPIPIFVLDRMHFDTPIEKLVYIQLFRHKDENGVSFPSVESLKQRCCCSRNSITNAVNALKEKGYIKVIRRFNSSNLFQILPIKEEKLQKVGGQKMEGVEVPNRGEVVQEVVEVTQDLCESHPADVNYIDSFKKINKERSSISITESTIGIREKNDDYINDDYTENYYMKNIHNMIASSIDVDLKLVKKCVDLTVFTLEELDLLQISIASSAFLRGEKDNKPSMRHFSYKGNLYKIMAGVYD